MSYLHHVDQAFGADPAALEAQDLGHAPGHGLALRPLDVLLLAVLVVGVVAFLAVRAGLDHSESIRRIRHYPARFDGQQVTLRGRVGEVFPMGVSNAYYLHQGRDTIVVFTRRVAPAKDRNVSVTGSISIGYLDGQPRPALFESPPQR